MQNMFSFWEPEILVHARWKAAPFTRSNKNIGTESNEFPWLTALHMCCQNSLLEELSSSGGNLLGEDSWKLVTSLLQTSPHALFPFVILLCILSL